MPLVWNRNRGQRVDLL